MQIKTERRPIQTRKNFPLCLINHIHIYEQQIAWIMYNYFQVTKKTKIITHVDAEKYK